MEWVDSVKRGADGWEFEVVASNGQRRACLTKELPDCARSLRQPGAQRHKVMLNLQTAKYVSAQDYLNGLNFTQTVSDKHQVYAFEVGRTRYLIPAIVLMRAFFRPFAPDLIKLLYLPQGLSLLCVPDLNSEKSTVKVFKGMWPNGTYQRPSMLAALSWMSCFPSANQMWHSVLMNAWNGALGLALPIGRAKLVLRGKVIGEDVFVTEVCLVSVETDEVPYAFAGAHPRSISFHDALQGAEAWRKRPPKSDASLEHRRGRVLSDEEWDAIRPIVEGKRPTRKLNLRYVVDGIIEKLASGVSWKDVQYTSGNCVNASQYYTRWLNGNVWGAVVSGLRVHNRCYSQ